MSVNCCQADSLFRFRTLPAALCLLFAGSFALAGETAVEPSGNGVDLLQDTTFDEDSRSSETSAAAEDLVEAIPAHPHDVPLADAVTTAEGLAEPLRLLGQDIAPGTAQRLAWSATELFEGVPVSTPVLIVNGELPGPTLCLTAAVHGDELNGIEMVRRVLHDIDPRKLSGAVIGVPIVNVQGFRRGSRYLPDRRDLNRYFPGNPNGSAAARIAHALFKDVIAHCDALVDLHTGSFERANLPQIRADLRNPDVVTLTLGFGSMVVLHSQPTVGTLRHAATMAGIPAVTVEAGGPAQLELAEVKHGVKGIETLLSTLGMVKKRRLWGDPEPVYYRSSWVRADNGGILLADVSLGSSVRKGDLLGTITDPMSNASTELRSPYAGRIIGMARNQVVMPGFAAFHVGIQAEDVIPEPVEEAVSENDRKQETGGYVDGMSE
ncbi:MAG: succinylglutamate desuccinylase/aspartoacylase family protein [Gammaproteobacteria bacterium]|nr:succinylglutamate desuccinylase/aspartoacylase family protein [Gammaproteobacteria bacterium]MDH3777905.1 succinylglutamate desuccinylase/aspartoacylase family protein [Gammaproteobacteria bacterium]MDH3810352.1 succinylglutamate desuccinylase/aspartoacylase family protein [Gammaproteobacteria bacterium]